MTRTLALAAAVLLLTAGCGGGSDTTAETPTATNPPGAVTGVPTPDPAQRAAYLAALDQIDPALAFKEERAIGRGRGVCLRLREAKRDPVVDPVDYTVRMLSGGDVTITKVQAGQVITAVKRWCPLE